MTSDCSVLYGLCKVIVRIAMARKLHHFLGIDARLPSTRELRMVGFGPYAGRRGQRRGASPSLRRSKGA